MTMIYDITKESNIILPKTVCSPWMVYNNVTQDFSSILFGIYVNTFIDNPAEMMYDITKECNIFYLRQYVVPEW